MIKDYCQGRINFSLGIGTWLTNDVENSKPLNIVIKMTGAIKEKDFNKKQKLIPTVKISDDLHKQSGDIETIKITQQLLANLS